MEKLTPAEIRKVTGRNPTEKDIVGKILGIMCILFYSAVIVAILCGFFQ